MRGLDRKSTDWLAVEAWAREQLAFERAALEEVGQEEKTADSCRGAIETLKKLLDLPDQEVVLPERGDNYGMGV